MNNAINQVTEYAILCHLAALKGQYDYYERMIAQLGADADAFDITCERMVDLGWVAIVSAFGRENLVLTLKGDAARTAR